MVRINTGLDWYLLCCIDKQRVHLLDSIILDADQTLLPYVPGPTRVFTDLFTDHFFFIFFCLARSSRVGDLKKNTRTPHARSCTAPQSNAVPAKGQQKTLKSNIYIKGKSFH